MFKKIFGETEKWEVIVVRGFQDHDVDMGGQDWYTNVPVGSIGIAVKNLKNGRIKVTMQDVKTAYNNSKVGVFFNDGDPECDDFQWVKQIGGKEEKEDKYINSISSNPLE